MEKLNKPQQSKIPLYRFGEGVQWRFLSGEARERARLKLWRFAWPDEDRVPPAERTPTRSELTIHLEFGGSHYDACAIDGRYEIAGVRVSLGEAPVTVTRCLGCGVLWALEESQMREVYTQVGPDIGSRLADQWGRPHDATIEPLIHRLVAEHVRALTLKRRQLSLTDAYGQVDQRKWDREKRYFYGNVLCRALSRPPEWGPWRYPPNWTWPLFNEVVEKAIVEFEGSAEYQRSPLSKSVDGISPLEYERYCADLLSERGWMTRLTRVSGDQGADIIAEKAGRRVVIQCKLHTKAIGNKAVQEVLSAMSFEDAESGAVVANSGFTPAARALAGKSGVALLHHSELDKLDEI